MKILELRFKNLNSLYDEWVIDFTDPEYVCNGIFVLTGPTGAGKSTILDAICLALYGATPRLGKITKSSNEIMSRKTGECYAEVLFESQAGRFRCHWEQRRAHRKAEGNLQDQEHQIADADTGELVETKKSLVVKFIEDKTGMDFDRFTRSILLAQGGFDTFLKADIEKKSETLEQITGTEIYSEISRRVHERQRDEQNKLNFLNDQASGIETLEPEQEKRIQQGLKDKQKQETELAGKLTETKKAIEWLDGIENLRKEILSLKRKKEKLQKKNEEFKPERVKLEQAVKAASLDGIYATLTAIRNQQEDDQNSLKTKKVKLAELEEFANIQAQDLKTAEQLTCESKKYREASTLLIRKIRSLDQEIAGLEEDVSETDKTCIEEAEKIKTDKQDLVEKQRNRTSTEKTLKTVEQYFRRHTQDEQLISDLSGIREQFDNLLTRRQEIAQKEEDLSSADEEVKKVSESLKEAKKQYSLKEQKLEESTKNLQRGKDGLSELLGDKSLQEYRTEREALLLENAYINNIEELEDHRANLEDGKPCPLCGSTKHPFAEGNIPVLDEKIELLTILVKEADQRQDAIGKLEKAETVARENLNHSKNLKSNANNEKRSATKALAELKDDLKRLKPGYKELKSSVSGKLKPLGVKKLPESEVEVSLLLKSLNSRLKEWQKQVEKKIEIEKKIEAIGSEVMRLDSVIKENVKALDKKQKRLKQLKEKLAAKAKKRKELYGNKKTDEEEVRLRKAIEDAEETEEEARRLNSERQMELVATETNAESLKNRIDQREPKLERKEIEFSNALESAGFTDEKLFCEARLANEKRDFLSCQAEKLKNAGIELKAKQNDMERRLKIEIEKKLTNITIEELNPQSEEYEDSLEQLRQTIAELNNELNRNNEKKELVKAKQSAIEDQKKECRRWENLNGLIGSHDGKKYRNFAQGLTFELMVSYANRQLEKMTDRYLLIHDEQRPLELNVVDNYQACEIRSTKNLSGGESFIVSLTLALGLSKMASQKVRVDSLFLDEGFGTLDQEALETVLGTLSGLQQDGKLIGIISHVSALKEKISTQINITRVSGGRSLLSGPGCTKG